MEYYAATKEGNLVIWNIMDGDPRCVDSNREKTQRYGEQTGGCQRRGVGWAEWVRAVKRYRPPVIK